MRAHCEVFHSALLGDEDVEAALRLLSPDEHARYARYVHEGARREYLTGRALVRGVLSQAMSLPPAAIRFVANAYGCPAVAPDLSPSPPRFNLAHSGGMAAMIVSPAHEVGIDVEPLARSLAILGLADTAFSPRERALIERLPAAERPAKATAIWTLKEAYIKARGMGLSLPLDAFHVDPGERIALDVDTAIDDGRPWQLTLHPLGSFVVACAVATPEPVAIAIRPFAR
jgi:4'-phosphopantetheinyl transferase